MELLVLLFILLLIFFVLINTLGFLTGAPYAPTPTSSLKKLLKYLKISKNDVIVDLGSGDGRLLLLTAQGGAKTIGYELNPFLYLLTILRINFSSLERQPKVYLTDFWKQDLGKATIIFAFILPQFMEKLEKKLKKEARPGTKLITYLSSLPNKKPLQSRYGFNLYKF